MERNYKDQIAVANQVKGILEKTSDIVDVDWMTEDNQTEYRLEVDKEKAMLNGIAPQQVVGNLTYLLKNILFQIYMMKILITALESYCLLMTKTKHRCKIFRI